MRARKPERGPALWCREWKNARKEQKMSHISRRDFGRLAGAVAAVPWSPFAVAQGAAKVVIVGGGAGGATAAHYIKKDAPELDVTLIESNPIYSSSFFSNLYLGGLRTLESLNHTYGGLARFGVKVINDAAIDVDTTKKVVRTRDGRSYHYDRLVLSPGIDMKYDSINGYSREVSRIMPHAYTTSAVGKRLLKHQLLAMRDGGTVVLLPPNNPYRCPPGPYERACMIAHYLKTKKPKSKLIILDPKKAFSKQAAITEAFEKYYKGIIELNLSTEIDDFAVASLDAKTKEIVTKAGKRVKADVANIIPQQRAGEIAVKAGCAEGDWCPINPENFASRKVKDVYVLGDSAIATDMPKSAFSANSQAKVVAADILADLAKKERFPARFRNTCWSLLAPDDGVKIGANYTPKDGRLDPSGSFVSQRGEPADVRKQNFQESVGWYAAITAEMFARPRPVSPAADQKAG
jgi:NADPH-dependent 2,4-dienoyl-CoA reductase/sulfur reductase-like enzyme